MFKKVSVPKTGSFIRNNVKSSVFGEMYEKVMESSTFVKTYGRGPECRPSSFPLCPVQIAVRLDKFLHLGYYEERSDMGGEYFTTVGTAAHEAIQFGMGSTGKVWGDWACRNPRCQRSHDARDIFDYKGKLIRKGVVTRQSTVNNICPDCRHEMDYVEKEVDYNGIKGHVDCIVKLAGGGWWVADYKTSTGNKIDKGTSLLPERAHEHQVPTYCLALEKQYKLKVAGYSILYLSRDNPYKFFEYAGRWDDTLRKKTKKMVMRQRKMFQAALMAVVRKDVSYAVDHKPCTSRRYYEEQHKCYSECPFVDQCFKPGFDKFLESEMFQHGHKQKYVKELLEKHKAILPKPLRIIE